MCIRDREILGGGLPSLFRQGLGSVATMTLNIAANPYGDAAIAAMSIVSRITMFASSALIGFGPVSYTPLRIHLCQFPDNKGNRRYFFVVFIDRHIFIVNTVFILPLSLIHISSFTRLPISAGISRFLSV